MHLKPGTCKTDLSFKPEIQTVTCPLAGEVVPSVIEMFIELSQGVYSVIEQAEHAIRSEAPVSTIHVLLESLLELRE